jgi:hypothetical protein
MYRESNNDILTRDLPRGKVEMDGLGPRRPASTS